MFDTLPSTGPVPGSESRMPDDAKTAGPAQPIPPQPRENLWGDFLRRNLLLAGFGTAAVMREQRARRDLAEEAEEPRG